MSNPRNAKRRALDIKIFEREAKAYELARRGLNLRQIGSELGISHTQANADWKNYFRKVPVKDLENARREAIDRLDADYEVLGRVIDAHVGLALGGDPESARVVADMVAKRTKLEERRAKLLGMDEPEKREDTVTVVDSTAMSLEERRARAKEHFGVLVPKSAAEHEKSN